MLARKRSPGRDKALQLWLDSGKTRALKDIAAELGVSDVQVRKWKNQDDWEGKNKVTLPKKKKSNVPNEKRPRGAPKGNRNAAGHGAPKGNKNNFKHGLYEEVYWDSLDADERRMIRAMELNATENLLKEQIQLLSVRERRLLRRIEDARNARGGLALESVVSRKVEQQQTETVTRTIATFDLIQKLEAELTRVQGRKTRCIALKHDIETADKSEEEYRLKIEKLRVEVEKLRGSTKEDAINKHNANISTLASMLRNPVANRTIADFEEEVNE